MDFAKMPIDELEDFLGDYERQYAALDRKISSFAPLTDEEMLDLNDFEARMDDVADIIYQIEEAIKKLEDE